MAVIGGNSIGGAALIEPADELRQLLTDRIEGAQRMVAQGREQIERFEPVVETCRVALATLDQTTVQQQASALHIPAGAPPPSFGR